MNFKKFIAVVAVICISFCVSGLLPVGAQTADTEAVTAPQNESEAASGSADIDVIYEASDAYKSSKYYENLKFS